MLLDQNLGEQVQQTRSKHLGSPRIGKWIFVGHFLIQLALVYKSGLNAHSTATNEFVLLDISVEKNPIKLII